MIEELQNELTYEQYNELQVFDITQISREFTDDVDKGMPKEYINKKYIGYSSNSGYIPYRSNDNKDGYLITMYMLYFQRN